MTVSVSRKEGEGRIGSVSEPQPRSGGLVRVEKTAETALGSGAAFPRRLGSSAGESCCTRHKAPRREAAQNNLKTLTKRLQWRGSKGREELAKGKTRTRSRGKETDEGKNGRNDRDQEIRRVWKKEDRTEERTASCKREERTSARRGCLFLWRSKFSTSCR